MPPFVLTLVVPVFNEAEAIAPFIETVTRVFNGQTTVNIEFVFINDGSTDSTLDRLLASQRGDTRIRIVDLSRNFGKEAALTAGLHVACGDAVVPIDADLQDPPELIPEMIEKWRQGNEVVLARRIDRQSDSWGKRASARWFYRLHNWISQPKLPDNVGDFRLMDRRVVEAIKELGESRRFMKGLFAWVGFRTAYIDYVRPPRETGSTKFNGWKLWNLALEGVTSFSTAPLRIWTYIGFFVALISFVFALFIMIKVLVIGRDVPGYASLMVVISFLGGIQIMGIGIIGEYLGRAYMESKRRPVFLIRQIYEPGQIMALRQKDFSGN
ncbi:MAG: glycosyltransferase [Thiobacillus sp.]|nr:glycosyltransferase [Thiobacillus sp.]